MLSAAVVTGALGLNINSLVKWVLAEKKKNEKEKKNRISNVPDHCVCNCILGFDADVILISF